MKSNTSISLLVVLVLLFCGFFYYIFIQHGTIFSKPQFHVLQTITQNPVSQDVAAHNTVLYTASKISQAPQVASSTIISVNKVPSDLGDLIDQNQTNLKIQQAVFVNGQKGYLLENRVEGLVVDYAKEVRLLASSGWTIGKMAITTTQDVGLFQLSKGNYSATIQATVADSSNLDIKITVIQSGK